MELWIIYHAGTKSTKKEEGNAPEAHKYRFFTTEITEEEWRCE